MERDRPVEMRPADLQLRLDVGEDEPRVLEIDHILAESLAVPCEGDRLVEGALRRRLRGDRDRKPLLRQIAHEIHEPAILSPQEVDGGYRDNKIGREWGRERGEQSGKISGGGG